MPRDQKSSALVELIVVFVVIGILTAVAIPRYLDMTRQAADGTARGVLGVLRGSNALLFGQRIMGGTTASYTMGVVAGTTGMGG
jgi:MSHA pilin protein MshA